MLGLPLLGSDEFINVLSRIIFQDDYAILLADEPATAVTALEFVSTFLGAANFLKPLELFQYWHGASGFREGPNLTLGKTCRIEKIDGERFNGSAACGAGRFSHRCNTEGGSSGGVIFLQGEGAVAGLHFLGDSTSNCAINVEKVAEAVRRAKGN